MEKVRLNILILPVIITLFLSSINVWGDPLAFSPVGGEAFGMGNSYVADFEDEASVLLNPAASVVSKLYSKRTKNSGKTVLSTGIAGRLDLKGASDFLTVMGKRELVTNYWDPRIRILSTGSIGRTQTVMAELPVGFSVFLRNSMFNDIFFESIPDNLHRYYLSKVSNLKEGGISMAFLFTPKLAVGWGAKLLYGTAYVGRNVEMGDPFASRIDNFYITRLMIGLGASMGFRYQINDRLFVGMGVDLPAMSLYERKRSRFACLTSTTPMHTKYINSYNKTGQRISGFILRMGVTWRPKYYTKFAAGLTLNPWPQRDENDFSFGHLLIPSAGFSQAITKRHWIAMGVLARLFSDDNIKLPGDTRTQDIEFTMLYKYRSEPVTLPWIGNVKINVSAGIRYSYIWGKIGGVTVTKTISCSEGYAPIHNLYVHSGDVLFKISVHY